MAHLIINQDATLRNDLAAFRSKFSAPQWKYFETILMGLLHCEGSKTLSGMLRQVAVVVPNQLHSAEAIRRFWALGLCLYQYLDSLRHRLQRLENQHLSLGEVRAWVLERHEDRQLDWICHQAKQGVKPAAIKQVLRPALSLSNCQKCKTTEDTKPDHEEDLPNDKYSARWQCHAKSVDRSSHQGWKKRVDLSKESRKWEGQNLGTSTVGSV